VKTYFLSFAILWIIAIYAISAAFLWFVARRYVGYGRVLAAVACMIAIDIALKYFGDSLLPTATLAGLLGSLAVIFALDFAIVLLIVAAPFWRSLLATAAYFVTLTSLMAMTLAIH
jgi:hypothetical protein